MPLAAADNADLILPTGVTQVQAPTGEIVNVWDYTGSKAVPCRFFEASAASRNFAFGQQLVVQATVLVRADEAESLNDAGNGTGERQQVKLNTPYAQGQLWEVTSVRDIGGVQRQKEIGLKRWK